MTKEFIKRLKHVKPPAGMPSQIRICDQPWAIKYAVNIVDEGRQLYGFTVPDLRLIYVDPSNAPDVVKTTLLHELLHAVFAMSHEHGLDGADQERAILAIEPTLLSLLKGNRNWWS